MRESIDNDSPGVFAFLKYHMFIIMMRSSLTALNT